MPTRTPSTDSTSVPPSKRRTPSQERSLQRVAVVLTAARDALRDVGYGGMTMLDIAARAGVSHSSIYHYFKSVDEILAALMQGWLDEFNVKGYRLLEVATTADDMIDACLAAWAGAFRMYRDTPIAGPLYAAARNVALVAEIEQADYRKWIQFMVAEFRRVSPHLDGNALHSDVTILVRLTVPMYDLILQQPKTQRSSMQGLLEEMLRFRLETTLARAIPERGARNA